MSDVGTPARVRLDAWREQNADRLHPMRFHFIEVLERRAAAHDGESRRLLDDRLSRLLEAYADDLDSAASHAGHADSSSRLCTPARGALGELVDHIVHCAATRGDDLSASDAAPQPPAFPQLEALDEFGKIWSKVRTQSQVRQSLEQVPTDAGPLNSGSLVHRSLTLMHELSPEYLQQFLAYVDALSWIEQMNDNGTLSTRHAPRATGAGKRAQGKPRERRE